MIAFPGQNFLFPGPVREIWGLYFRESRVTGIPAHPCQAEIKLYKIYIKFLENIEYLQLLYSEAFRLAILVWFTTSIKVEAKENRHKQLSTVFVNGGVIFNKQLSSVKI